jgi:hypothetical protein
MSDATVDGTLRERVAQTVDVQWSGFAERHPNLAAAIDRVRLVDSAVESIRADPAYRAALDAAARDDQSLTVAADVVQLIESAVRRLMLHV